VGGLTGVPDPRYSNPELFDLSNPDAPIPQFVNAMKMAGIEVTPEQVAQEITYQQLKDGNLVVAVYKLDPAPSKQGETLEGRFPLIVGERDGQSVWQWDNIASSLNALNRAVGVRLGTQVVHYKLSDPQYTGVAAGNFNAFLIDGELNEPDLWLPPRTQATNPYERYGTYDLSRATAVLNFAQRSGAEFEAHHIIGGRFEDGVPNWLLESNFSRKEYIDVLKAHVRQVASFLPALTPVSVVNEAFDWDRIAPDSFWNQKIGPEYIEIAFREARESNPNAILYYNDVNVFADGGIDDHDRAVFALVRRLRAKGLIDGVGFQMHIDEKHRPVPADVVKALIKMYEEIGVRVYITEFDVDLTYLGLPEQQRQLRKTQVFGEMFELFLTSQNVGGITFFGFTSDVSWKPDADAHLFGEMYRPEPAFYEVARLLLKHIDK